MRKYKGNIKDQLIDFAYWSKIWGSIFGMVAKSPVKIVKGLFRYPWIYDLLKVQDTVRRHSEGRTGAALHLNVLTFSEVVKLTTKTVSAAILDPEHTINCNILIPTEIYQAMGLNYIGSEFPDALLPVIDQHSCEKYMDFVENLGLPGDTCSYPRIAEGMALAGHLPKCKCLVSVNLACDGATAAYNAIEQKLELPSYCLCVPYDFKSEEAMEAYAEDIRGMIAFLEKETGHKMDWDKLREICGRFNEMQQIEIERMEILRTSNPTFLGDNIWLPHFSMFNMDSGSESAVKLYKKSMKIIYKALERNEAPISDMRYRAVLWNPPTFAYSHFWNWLERCWGVGIVMDLETFGYTEPIDLSSDDAMLKTLGKSWMCQTMSRQMRGKAENYTDDFLKMIELFKPDFVIVADHVACRNSMGMSGIMNELARERDMPLCHFNYELMDSRVCSRQGIRNQISEFMMNIMHAEPLDASLLKIDDNDSW